MKHKIWDKIQKLLDKRNMTIWKLGKTMNVSDSVLRNLRDGKIKKPSFELMCKIADALNVSLDYFRDNNKKLWIKEIKNAKWNN